MKPSPNKSNGIAALVWNNPRIGLFMLLLALVVGSKLLLFGNFVDEGDKLAVGLLVSRGHVMYRDVFSHHFPFTYYWVASVLMLFGNSIVAVRFSMLLFQIISFAVVMKLTRSYCPVGLVALIWSVIAHFYFGNMALYNVFSGVAIFATFAIVAAITIRFVSAGLKELLALGIFATIAILSDPLAVFAISFSILVLAISSAGLRRALFVALMISINLMLYFAYLVISETFGDFYRDVVLFNVQVYPRYYKKAGLGQLLGIVVSALKGLYILDASKWMTSNLLLPFVEYSLFEQWLFAGFFYRLSVILVSVILLIRRQILSASFIYLFAAIVLLRSNMYFRQTPFILVSLLATVWLVSGTWDRLETFHGENENLNWSTIHLRDSHTFTKYSHRFVRLAMGLILAWLTTRGIVSTIKEWNQFSYEANFEGTETTANEIRAITCNQDVALAFYPGDPIIHFFTGMRPVSRYVYMWPWVADVALPEVISSLESEKAVVFLDETAEVWGRKTTVYLADLRAYLDENYVKSGRFYLSPTLVAECKADISSH